MYNLFHAGSSKIIEMCVFNYNLTLLNSDEEIDRDSFECLTEESIKKMIPKAQPQSIFLRNWREKYQNNEAPSLSDNDIINNDSNNIVFSEYEDDNISMSSTPSKELLVNIIFLYSRIIIITVHSNP